MSMPHTAIASERQPPRGRAIGVLLVVVAVLLGAAVVQLQEVFLGRELLLVLLVGLITLLPLLLRMVQGTFDLFEPLTMVCAVYLLYFSFAPLVRITTGDYYWLGRDWHTSYEQGLIAVIAPILSTWLGYALPIGETIGRRLSRPMPLTWIGLRTVRLMGWIMTYGAIFGLAAWGAISGAGIRRFLLPGLLSRGAQDPNGGPDIQYLFMTMEWFVPAFLMLCASDAFRTRAARAFYWFMVIVVYLSIAFRYRLLIFVVAGAVLYYLRRDRRPRLTILIPSGAFMFILLGWMSMVRSYFSSYGQQGGLGFSWVSVLKSGLADTRIFETFVMVLNMVPDFSGHVGLLPFYYLFVIPIPRFLWPAKPDPSWIRIVGPAIGTPEAVTSGAAVPNFGEYYIALGWPGVIAGTIVFGILVRVLWEWYRADRTDPMRQVIFSICYIWILQVIIRGYLAQIAIEFCFFVLPAIVVMYFARRTERRYQPDPWPDS